MAVPGLPFVERSSHSWAFGAIGELIGILDLHDGCAQMRIDVCNADRDPMIIFRGVNTGLNPSQLREIVGPQTKAGYNASRFATCVLRLGENAILASHCAMTSTMSLVGLSLTSVEEANARGIFRDVEPAAIDYTVLPDGQYQQQRSTDAEEWYQNLTRLLAWSPFRSESQLLEEVAFLEHGVAVYIYGLRWQLEAGIRCQLELDFQSDVKDILLRGEHDRERVGRDQTHVSKLFRFSLRSYLSIMFLRPSYEIFLRGNSVAGHDVTSDLNDLESQEYRPMVGGAGGQVQGAVVKTTLGWYQASTNAGIRGVCLYHKNRLVKGFWDLVPSPKGTGVLAVVDATILEPELNVQDFKDSSLLTRVLQDIRMKIREYRQRVLSKKLFVPTAPLLSTMTPSGLIILSGSTPVRTIPRAAPPSPALTSAVLPSPVLADLASAVLPSPVLADLASAVLPAPALASAVISSDAAVLEARRNQIDEMCSETQKGKEAAEQGKNTDEHELVEEDRKIERENLMQSNAERTLKKMKHEEMSLTSASAHVDTDLKL